MNNLTDTLRKAIERDGRGCTALGEASGVDRAAISRFMRNQRGLTTTSVDALCKALGVNVKLIRQRQRKGAK